MIEGIEFELSDVILELQTDWKIEGSTIKGLAGEFPPAAACAHIVLLSAELATFVEEVYLEYARTRLSLSQDEFERMRDNLQHWGNPSPENIERLFNRVGRFDVFNSECIQSDREAKAFLNGLNRLRNKIAHGKTDSQLLKDVPLSIEAAKERRTNALTFASYLETLVLQTSNSSTNRAFS